MNLDPTIIIAIVGVVGSIATVWHTTRGEKETAKITAHAESVKMSVELDVKREEILAAGLESHFTRLELQVGAQTDRIDALTERVTHLEEERWLMLAWMTHNGVKCPPPGDFPNGA